VFSITSPLCCLSVFTASKRISSLYGVGFRLIRVGTYLWLRRCTYIVGFIRTIEDLSCIRPFGNPVICQKFAKGRPREGFGKSMQILVMNSIVQYTYAFYLEGRKLFKEARKWSTEECYLPVLFISTQSFSIRESNIRLVFWKQIRSP